LTWKPVDKYHAKNGNWSMTINGSKEAGNLKFALFEGDKFIAVCETQKQAVEKHKQLTEGIENGKS
jgi:hypothetical protein